MGTVGLGNIKVKLFFWVRQGHGFLLLGASSKIIVLLGSSANFIVLLGASSKIIVLLGSSRKKYRAFRCVVVLLVAS